MRTRPLWVVILGTLILGTTAYLGKVQATPSAGFTATTLAVGRFGDINASSHVFFPDDSEGRDAEKPLAFLPEDEGALRPLCPEQRLGAGGNHRLAHSPESQPDDRDGRDADGL